MRFSEYSLQSTDGTQRQFLSGRLTLQHFNLDVASVLMNKYHPLPDLSFFLALSFCPCHTVFYSFCHCPPFPSAFCFFYIFFSPFNICHYLSLPSSVASKRQRQQPVLLAQQRFNCLTKKYCFPCVQFTTEVSCILTSYALFLPLCFRSFL